MDDTNNKTLISFDPAALRLNQSYANTVGVKRLTTTVPVRKPNRQDFVRVQPLPAYRLGPTGIIELKEDREVYLVTPNMAQELPGEFTPATLFTTINRQGVLASLAGEASGARRQAQRMAPLGGRGC